MVDWLVTVSNLFNQQPDMNRTGYLTAFFTVRPEYFTDSRTFVLDIVRSGEEIAPTVRSLNAGAIAIAEDQFTNKEFPFPVYALESSVNIDQLMTRQPGENPYLTGGRTRVEWMGRVARILIPSFAKMTNMIRRAMEYQAAQVLQTGRIMLTDENGKSTYELDLKPKMSHFPTVITPWSSVASATPLQDIDTLADVITADGQCDVENLIFGATAWKNFIQNDSVRALLNKDTLNLGALDPHLIGKGGKYLGYIDWGAHRYLLWLYDANYNPFGSTETEKYLCSTKVLFLPNSNALDFRRMFGGIPSVNPNPILDEMFGGKIEVEGEYDFRTRVRYDEQKDTFIGEVKSSPVLLPISIDRYGCLETEEEIA
jgi:hypothetical protein